MKDVNKTVESICYLLKSDDKANILGAQPNVISFL